MHRPHSLTVRTSHWVSFLRLLLSAAGYSSGACIAYFTFSFIHHHHHHPPSNALTQHMPSASYYASQREARNQEALAIHIGHDGTLGGAVFQPHSATPACPASPACPGTPGTPTSPNGLASSGPTALPPPVHTDDSSTDRTEKPATHLPTRTPPETVEDTLKRRLSDGFSFSPRQIGNLPNVTWAGHNQPNQHQANQITSQTHTTPEPTSPLVLHTKASRRLSTRVKSILGRRRYSKASRRDSSNTAGSDAPLVDPMVDVQELIQQYLQGCHAAAAEDKAEAQAKLRPLQEAARIARLAPQTVTASVLDSCSSTASLAPHNTLCASASRMPPRSRFYELTGRRAVVSLGGFAFGNGSGGGGGGDAVSRSIVATAVPPARRASSRRLPPASCFGERAHPHRAHKHTHTGTIVIPPGRGALWGNGLGALI